MKKCDRSPRNARVGQIVDVLTAAGEAFVNLVYPPHCAICQTRTQPGAQLCADCLSSAIPISPPFCRQCSEPCATAFHSEFTCSTCERNEYHFRCAVAPFRARTVVRELVHQFKYNGRYHLRWQLSAWLVTGLQDERLQNPPVDGLVPVPLHSAKLRERKFNQAAELAHLLSISSAIPVMEVLERSRYTGTQTLLDRESRMENLRNAFSVVNREQVPGRHLLLIDDIYTTGSTVEECARTLCTAEAASVRVLTVARA